MDSAKYEQKILLLSEIPDVKEQPGVININEIRTQVPEEATADIEASSETLLTEPELPVIVNETVQTLDNDKITGNEIGEKNSQSYQLIDPLPVQNAVDSHVKKSLPEQIQPDLKQTKQDAELDSLAEPGSGSGNNETVKIEDDNASQDFNYPLVACYQLKKGEYTQNTFTQGIEDNSFKLEFFEQQQRDADSFLVLTIAALSSQEALSREQEMKQQGLNDLWLFQQGLFKWRISLGLFSGEEQANKAKELFSEKTNQELEVVPSYLTKTVTIVKVRAQEEHEVVNFEQKYSMVVDQKIGCSKVKN